MHMCSSNALMTAYASGCLASGFYGGLFHLEGGTIPPHCALHFLPFISIRVNRLCIYIVFGRSPNYTKLPSDANIVMVHDIGTDSE